MIKEVTFCTIILILLISCGSDITPKDNTQEVILSSVQGEVLVNNNPASQGMSLKQGDVIQTKEGEATLSFVGNSSVLRLDYNTMITLSNIDIEDSQIEITQESGQTWTRLLKITGVEQYKIQTPSTVATVRGTGFGVSVTDQGTEVAVEEGEVTVQSFEEAEELLFEEEKIQINRKEQRRVIQEMKEDGKMKKWMMSNMKKDEAWIERMANRMLKDKESMTEREQERAKVALKEYMTGKHNREYLIENRILSRKQAEHLPMGTELTQRRISHVISQFREDKVQIQDTSRELIREIDTMQQMTRDIEEMAYLLE